MDTSSKQSLFWRLMFIFCIYVPGMTFDAIGSSTAPATTTTTSASSSLLRKSMDDQTFPRAQLSTLATITKTNPPKSSTITIAFTRSLTTATTPTNDAALEIKATNVRFSTGTKDSLSPSTITNASTKASKEEAITSSSSSSAAAALTSSTTAEARTTAQVTIDSQWTTDDGVNNGAYKTSNNDEQGSIIDNKTNNIKIKNNNNNINYGISQMMNDNSKSEFEQQNLLKNSLSQAKLSSQKPDALNFKQFVREVQQDVPALNNTIVEAKTNQSNYFVTEAYDKNMQHHEMPTNEKLMMATTTIMAPTSEATTTFEEATLETSKMYPTTSTTTTISSLSSSSFTSAPVDVATNTTTTTTSSSTTTTSTTTTTIKTTTTLKPLLPLAVDGYQTITSQAGTHAYLPCNVKQLVKKPISWLRVRDGHILTVDQTTFIADQRFQSIYTPNPERWSLQIKFVQTKDAGTYECQVSTEPKTSAIVTLLIVEPKTELIGEATRHVKAGSQVKLRCIISQALEPPVFINWFFNQKQIYLHNRRDWRTEIERIELSPDSPPITAATKSGTETSSTLVLNNNVHSSMSLSVGKDRATAKLLASTETVSAATTTTTAVAPPTTTTATTDIRQITTASLIIPSVEKQDSGNYTCSPSNSAPMTVVLHVLNGEYSASAITSGISSNLFFIGRNIGEKRHYHWHNATIVLILLWLLWFLYSLRFAKEQNAVYELNVYEQMYNTRCELAASDMVKEHSATPLKSATTIELLRTKKIT